MEEKNNRYLKGIQSIFTITMLDYFPHMSVFHHERTGFDHNWTRILCVYSAGTCLFDSVACFKFENNMSNVKSVERRGIKIKKKCSSQSSLMDTCVRAKLKSVSERRKSVTTGRTNEPTDSWSPIYPHLFMAGVQKSYQNWILKIKKSTYLVKVPPPFDPCSYPPQKTQLPVCIKFATAHTFILPLH